MIKKVVSLLLIIALVLATSVGCGGASISTADNPECKKVGVAMPLQSVERWINDGANMKRELEALGYEVMLLYAEDDIQVQAAQIENMIACGCDCIVIAAVDSTALINAEKQAIIADVPIIAYDRLLMNTDAVSYYATFDNKAIGRMLGEYVIEKSGASPETPKTIELFMGSPDDNNAHVFYEGIMEVIQPLLDDGSLVCRSGQIDFEENCILRWDQQASMRRCEDILSRYYSDEKLDIVLSPSDTLSYGCMSALDSAGYKVGKDWPILTGQDAEVMAVKYIISGRQTMSIAKDTRLLASKCVKMVEAVLEGTEPEINDTESYDNNVKIVPSYLCTPQIVDKSNYKEVLIDSGYYKEEQLMQ